METGSFIRQSRSALGLSLRSLAQQLGVDAAYLSRIESGRVPPSEQMLRKLATVLGRNEDELLLLSGRLPERLRELVSRQPHRAATALRTMAEMCVAEPGAPYGKPLLARQGRRAIEDEIPFERISEIAEVESWRKEVYRPVYHVHKWWAQRLGSVFRAAIIAAAAPRGSSVMDLFYEPLRLPGLVVFDPFMGSGTTVGEAQKLGCTVIGRDINPVAYRTVRVALGPIDRAEVHAHFKRIEASAGREIQRLYRSIDGAGESCRVLYFFWVKVLPCPRCGDRVDLFPNYVFASHADKARHPEAMVVCPDCGAVSSCRYDTRSVACPCGAKFDPRAGSARRTTAVCRRCAHEFPIARTAAATGEPPGHRMYAKLVLRADGAKEYLPATGEDLRAFEAARGRFGKMAPAIPAVPIEDGYNTRQILNYGYRFWHELFNDRQLLALTILASSIRDLPEGGARDALSLLFSGVLEFNNMFASYKGEGTGAVRHMFSHHILKPERMPIEANPWGTPKSSGAFSTLYKSRLMRALDYREAPFELAVEYKGERKSGRKVFGASPPMGGPISNRYPKGGLKPGATCLSCGDSAKTDLPDKSVDLVMTDPPFFDNVHYSELADFFFAWQQLHFPEGTRRRSTTRRPEEVQDTEADRFAWKLKGVFLECNRVLRDQGLLVFSYHHSRESGWIAVSEAVLGAGFSIVQSQPVKSEMSVAAPKNQARQPIDIDVLIVCRKREADLRKRRTGEAAFDAAVGIGFDRVQRFNALGRKLSRNDVRVVLSSQLLVELSPGRSACEARRSLESLLPKTDRLIDDVWRAQTVQSPSRRTAPGVGPEQLSMLDASPDPA